MKVISKYLHRYQNDKEGATAVEAAIIFPILIAVLFAVFGIGTYLYGTHQAQRTVEETARMARIMDQPSQDELSALLKQNMKNAMFGTYEPNVTIVNQFDGDYAELAITYNFNFEFPLLDLIDMQSISRTQVKLRFIPI